MRRQLIVAVTALSMSPAWAQDEPYGDGSAAEHARSNADADPPRSLLERTGRVIEAAMNAPLHPVFRDVGPSSALGIGLGYDLPTADRWRATTSAVVTTRHYWSLQLDTTYEGERFDVAAYARLRDLNRLSFFGLGAGSELTDRTTFRLRDPVVGAVAAIQLAPWVSAGGRVEQLWPAVGGGSSSTVPSIEERFDESGVPGLAMQPRYARYEAFLEAEVPAAAGGAVHQGTTSRASFGAYEDRDFDRFTFQRLDLEVQQAFAFFGSHRRLTLHAMTSMTFAREGHEVPFFLQPTLGGTAQVARVDADPIGTDGRRATLRGFRSLRFRDRHLLLLQAEYRIPVWGPLDTTVFVDAGKVAGRPGALNLSDLERSYGVSISVMRGPAAAARLDVGFGSGEGTRVLLSVGDFLP